MVKCESFGIQQNGFAPYADCWNQINNWMGYDWHIRPQAAQAQVEEAMCTNGIIIINIFIYVRVLE